MTIFSASDISKSIHDKMLFENVFFGMDDTDRVGIIGRNGAGKTTFLRVIAGIDTPDTGIVAFNKGSRFEYLEQLPRFDRHTIVLEAAMSGKPDIAHALMRHEDLCKKSQLTAEEEQELHKLHQLIDEKNGWALDSQAKSILSRLGMELFDADVMNLSGGQRKRVALARALLSDPDLLILDEPTNHLDAGSVQWLQDYLQQSQKGLLLVTHDRYFLDAVTNKIIELDRNTLYSYPGNFEKYLERKEAMIVAEEAAADHLRNKLRQELAWLQKGAKARRTKQQSRIDWIAKMQAEPAPTEEKNIKIELGNVFLGGRIIDAYNISKHINNTVLFHDFTYSAAPGDKIGIIGPNGTGKSTLLNTLAGLTEPDSGSVKLGETVKIGYFRQEITDLAPRQTVIGALREIAEYIDVGVGRERFITAKELLDKFLFPPRQHHSLIETLSGGEKRRLGLLRILMNNPNVLLLDEPTNDFDIATLSALEEHLSHFKGVLIIVSHDRSFLDKTVDFIYAFEENGHIKQYPGNYSSYLEKIEQKKEQERNTKSQATVKEELPKREKSKKSGLSFKEQKEYEEAEKSIERLEKEKTIILQTLETMDGADYKAITELSEKLAGIEEQLDTITLRWLELEEKK